MAVDFTLQDFLREQKARSEGQHPPEGLQHGGGGGTSDGMEARVTRLETHMEYVRRDLDEIKSLLRVLPELATKRDLETWRWQWLATGIGIVAITVGGITGGLALIARFAG